MLKRVLKYDLSLDSTQDLMLPKGAQILLVGVQRENEIKLWALVDEDKEPVKRTIRIVATGESFDSRGATYIGSFTAAGWFVGHAFEDIDFVR